MKNTNPALGLPGKVSNQPRRRAATWQGTIFLIPVVVVGFWVFGKVVMDDGDGEDDKGNWDEGEIFEFWHG